MNFTSNLRRRRAMALIELLMTMGVIAIIGGIVYGVTRAGMVGFAKNFSLNQSSYHTRAAAALVVRNLEGAIDEPQLADYASGKLTTSTATYANCIRFHRLRPAYYQVTGPSATTTNGLSWTSETTTTIDIKFNIDGLSTNQVTQAAPAAGDRIFFLYPNSMLEDVTAGYSPGKKQGRGITAVSGSGNTRALTISSTPGSGKKIYCNNPCLIATEYAFITRVVGSGTSKRRELHLLRTSAMTGNEATDLNKNTLITRDLDADTTVTDSGGATVLPFKVLSFGNADKRVQVDLPLRIMDYVGVFSWNKGAKVGTTGLNKDEFSSYVRSTLTVPLRNRGMLPPLDSL